ncbi:MAG: hypothetical protein K940chlam3_01477 [Chlamydiae bacterium]|nr:hypothetical protein [Chlamydiota bacterium]
MRSLAAIFLSIYLVTASAEEETVPLFPKCVDYKGWAPINVFQSQLIFFNQCFMPVYIRVCVKDWIGDHKLYTSFQRVKTYGWIRMNIETSSEPKAIEFTYDHFLPPIPGPCKSQSQNSD